MRCVPGGDNFVMGVQRYEFLGGKALKNHAFYVFLRILLSCALFAVVRCAVSLVSWSCQVVVLVDVTLSVWKSTVVVK